MANKNPAALELASRLRSAGHEVTFASHQDISQPIATEGFSFFRLTADQNFADKAKSTARPRPLMFVALWRWLRARRKIRTQSLHQAEVEDLIARLNPDVLLIDVECHYFIMAASRTSVPIALPMLWFSIFRCQGLPPLHATLQPGDNFGARLAIMLSWIRTRAASLRDRLATTYGRHAIADLLRPVPYNAKGMRNLKALARAKGFDWRVKTDRSQWLRPFVYPDLPTLCLNVYEADFPHQPPRNVTYVGPMIRSTAPAPENDGSSQTHWARFQHYRVQSDNTQRPLVYCSLGSFWAPDEEFLTKIINVFRKRTDWDLAIGLGGAGPEHLSRNAPGNVFVFNWAPQRALLQSADCAISHGGVSTINECIALGVPMLIYSTSKVDQNGNAARVAYHGLGLRADNDASTLEKIEANIETCLSNREFKTNLARMKDAMETYRRDNTAVKILEELARRR